MSIRWWRCGPHSPVLRSVLISTFNFKPIRGIIEGKSIFANGVTRKLNSTRPFRQRMAAHN